MRPIHRHVHLDFHNLPGIYDFCREWDAAVFAQQLQDANVDFVNFCAQCNLGFAYYATKVGIPYPGMKGDMLGDVLRECHARGIGVAAYINVGLMHEHAFLHPEWCRLDKNGAILRGDRTGNFFRTMCYNSPGYHRHLLDTIREICAYDIDGLFCDCMHFFPCHCAQCTQDMLARGIDIEDENAVEAFSREVMLRVAREIQQIAGTERHLYFNGMPVYAYRGLDTHIELECLPSGGWGYDFLWSSAAYARSLQRTVLYVTGRFQAGWGDFGGYKGKASLENDVFDALCNNLLPSVGDHMHPAKMLSRDLYRDIGDIFARVRAYESYTRGARFLAEVGVLTDDDGFPGDAYKGLARMLAELKQGFDIVHTSMEISRFALVILPDGLAVDEALAQKLRAYLSQGGKILSTGTGGLASDGGGFALPEYAADCEGLDPSNDSYFAFENLPEGTADMPWSMYAPGILVRARAGAQVYARHIQPYFSRHWDGRHGYFYTPPERESGFAAAVLCGNVAHISFDIFGAYFRSALREHKRLVAQLLDALLPEPLIRPLAGIPSKARVTATATERYTLLHVKITSPEPRGRMEIVEEHDVLPAGARVGVRGRYSKVCRVPDGAPVRSWQEGKYTVLELPQIVGYDMFILEGNEA